MRVLWLISNMGPGGAERVMTHLVAYFSIQYKIQLMTLEAPGTQSFYRLPPSIDIVQSDLLHKTGLLRRPLSILARFCAIHRQIRAFRPDVVVSFMDTLNIITVTVCYASGTPVVISERIDPARHSIGVCKSILRRLVYPLANCCVVQSERVQKYFDRFPRVRMAVISNPVQIPRQQANPGRPNERGRFQIVALGRLERQKGFDRLLDAFAGLAPSFPDWDLVIFGEGSARAGLEYQLRELRLSGRVLLPGVTESPVDELAASHIMAFPSHYEGFPNALAEALAVGLPAVGFANVSGVEELIIDEETGLLVDDADEKSMLADALRRLMRDADLRSNLGLRARRHVEKWRPELIFEQWEALLADIAMRKGSSDVRN